MKLWAIVENGKPLQMLERPDPQPQGTEVVVAVTHCGLCHSDLHFWKGEYDLGGGNILRLADRGVQLPRAPGHEVLGTVVAVGPDARGVAVGDRRVVFPWLGCGTCEICRSGNENLCMKPSAIGVVRDGGFGSHVVVPHPKYLVDFGHVDPAVAATLACSGITTYSAIRKLQPLDPKLPILLVGAGGVGFAAIRMLQALGHTNIIVVDLSLEKRAAAIAAGASHAIDGNGDNVVQAVLDAAGGPVMAAMDFVNIPSTVKMALECLGKNGKLVLIGVGGGELPLSLAGMIFRPCQIIGSATGSLQDLIDVVELAKSGKLQPVPVTTVPKDQAFEAMMRLKAGTVTGRIVLEG